MLIVIRNKAGIGLFLARPASGKTTIRFKVSSDRPQAHARVERLRSDKDFGLHDLPDDLRVIVERTGSQIPLAIRRRRRRVPRLNDKGRIVGHEIFREYTVRLAN